MGDWILAVHSGAGSYGSTNEAAYLAVLRAALERGHDVLATSTCRPTAAQVAVHLLHSFEHSLLTNAGLNANLTEEGRVECEASVVCGRTHLVSSCGAVRGVKEPSALALKLLEQVDASDARGGAFAFGRQPPLVVVGDQARRLAQKFGLETASENEEELRNYQVTAKTRAHWDKWRRRFQDVAKAETEEQLDTVGAICIDPMGNVAAALSSGGVAYKVPGRLGLAGCPRMGCDARNGHGSRKRKRHDSKNRTNAFALASTGRGEHFIRSNFVGNLSRRLAKAVDLEHELRKAFVRSSRENGDVAIQGGVLALVSAPLEHNNDESLRHVQLGAAFTTPCMGVGYSQYRADASREIRVQLLRLPDYQKSRTADKLAVHVSSLQLHPEPERNVG